MTRITLVCAAGISTSLLVSKMNLANVGSNERVSVKAVPEGDFEKYADQTDILMLGPQVSYMLDKMKKQYEPKGIKVTVIDRDDYSSLNGEKVLKDALALAKK